MFGGKSKICLHLPTRMVTCLTEKENLSSFDCCQTCWPSIGQITADPFFSKHVTILLIKFPQDGKHVTLIPGKWWQILAFLPNVWPFYRRNDDKSSLSVKIWFNKTSPTQTSPILSLSQRKDLRRQANWFLGLLHLERDGPHLKHIWLLSPVQRRQPRDGQLAGVTSKLLSIKPPTPCQPDCSPALRMSCTFFEWTCDNDNTIISIFHFLKLTWLRGAWRIHYENNHSMISFDTWFWRINEQLIQLSKM